jgi:hypothetical protein
MFLTTQNNISVKPAAVLQRFHGAKKEAQAELSLGLLYS